MQPAPETPYISAPHTDIVATGWVARLPAALRPYALLARLDRPIGIWLLYLPGAWGILLAQAPWRKTLGLLILFALGSVAMRAAGCVVNDLWDRDLDRRVTRTAGRPLASGLLRPRHALLFLAALLLAGLAVLLQLNPLAQALGVFSLVPVALYPAAKRVTRWPQLVLGFTFGFGAPMGYAAAAGHLNWIAAALYGAAILWDLGFDTIYAHQDREDDAALGIGSTALLFGARTKPFLTACYTGVVLLLLLSGWAAQLSWWFFLMILEPAALLGRQIRELDIDNPALCLNLFRLNARVGRDIALAIWFAWP